MCIVISTIGDQTSDNRAETLQLSHLPIQYASDVKLVIVRPINLNVLQETSVLFTEDKVTSRATSSQGD